MTAQAGGRERAQTDRTEGEAGTITRPGVAGKPGRTRISPQISAPQGRNPNPVPAGRWLLTASRLPSKLLTLWRLIAREITEPKFHRTKKPRNTKRLALSETTRHKYTESERRYNQPHGSHEVFLDRALRGGRLPTGAQQAGPRRKILPFLTRQNKSAPSTQPISSHRGAGRPAESSRILGLRKTRRVAATRFLLAFREICSL